MQPVPSIFIDGRPLDRIHRSLEENNSVLKFLDVIHEILEVVFHSSSPLTITRNISNSLPPWYTITLIFPEHYLTLRTQTDTIILDDFHYTSGRIPPIDRIVSHSSHHTIHETGNPIDSHFIQWTTGNCNDQNLRSQLLHHSIVSCVILILLHPMSPLPTDLQASSAILWLSLGMRRQYDAGLRLHPA